MTTNKKKLSGIVSRYFLPKPKHYFHPHTNISPQKFLEWQQDQPEFSSPESLLSDVDPTSNFDHQPFQADNRFSQAEDIPVTMSPKSRLQTPQNIAPPMNEDSTLYPPPGPQLPKIGRPRSTPNTLSTPDLEAGKAPSQAVSPLTNKQTPSNLHFSHNEC